MANCESSVSSSPGEQFRFVDLKLSRLNDEEIKIQVEQTHLKRYSLVLRQPLLDSISHILEPATNFVDSILLNKVSKNGTELETNNILELNSTFSELDALVGGRCFSARTLLEREVPNRNIVFEGSDQLEEFSTISELRTLARNDYFMIPTLQMDKTADDAVQRFDEINLHKVSMDILEYLRPLSWDAKAINTMACLVFKFLEFLGFLLHGLNQPITELASSMAALKENPISLMGSPLEKFEVPLDRLNNITKLTLEVIECIFELTLLSDTEHNKENLLSTSAYWAILSSITCYIQINLLMRNGEVALELSHLKSNLSHILNDLRHYCTICKPQIEEMEVHLQHIAFFEDAFGKKKKLSDTPAEMSELMKSFMYSKDGCHSFMNGSIMSQIDLEVLKEKAVIFFISDLDIDTWKLTHLQSVHEQIKEEDYYKIVWVPFVLKWTEEMRQKFENLKSKMPWYMVCYDSPIAGVCNLSFLVYKHGLLVFTIIQSVRITQERAHPVGPEEGGFGMSYDLLCGRAGFLWAALFINKHLGQGTVPNDLVMPVVEAVFVGG
ncbi:protein SIEVE ELEMENT OCCLUSION B-like [Diospyros lotus]|uniref:protein SIEVE ELEMENT OCCLUSION B-like n=1 Tax=Diospyros lotus TaxID=55363 RepID=UPI00224E238E|nr:protein SIEVE ELEMENT OCCLUSION B-like [Diospyros lotus]